MHSYLQRRVRGLPEPIRAGMGRDLERLDLPGVLHVGASAKIDERATAVGSGDVVVADLFVDDLLLELVV
jgi:hypothetical protein